MEHERRLHEFNRREFRRHAYASLPTSEWWSDIPWYPNSRPHLEQIKVIDYFDGPVARVETVGLLTEDTIETVTDWYIARMPNLGWTFLADESAIKRGPSADSSWIKFSKENGSTIAEVSIGELAQGWEFLNDAPNASDNVYRVAELIRNLTSRSIDSSDLHQRAGDKLILLSHTERRASTEAG